MNLPTVSASWFFCLLPQALVEFFQRVVDHQAKNKMTLNNVSVIMAPNIFMFKGFRSKVTEQQERSMAAGTANIVRLLIRYQNLLWTVRLWRNVLASRILQFKE